MKERKGREEIKIKKITKKANQLVIGKKSKIWTFLFEELTDSNKKEFLMIYFDKINQFLLRSIKHKNVWNMTYQSFSKVYLKKEEPQQAILEYYLEYVFESSKDKADSDKNLKSWIDNGIDTTNFSEDYSPLHLLILLLKEKKYERAESYLEGSIDSESEVKGKQNEIIQVVEEEYTGEELITLNKKILTLEKALKKEREQKAEHKILMQKQENLARLKEQKEKEKELKIRGLEKELSEKVKIIARLTLDLERERKNYNSLTKKQKDEKKEQNELFENRYNEMLEREKVLEQLLTQEETGAALEAKDIMEKYDESSTDENEEASSDFPSILVIGQIPNSLKNFKKATFVHVNEGFSTYEFDVKHTEYWQIVDKLTVRETRELAQNEQAKKIKWLKKTYNQLLTMR